MSEQPYEIVTGPFEVYVAPVGESFAAVTAEPPGGNWVLLGTSGADNITEDGVTLTMSETLEHFRSLGGTGIRKSFRTEEDFIVAFLLADLTLEEWVRVLNFNTVSTDSDDRTIPLYKGADVATRALLIRGNDKSAYGTGFNAQFELPRVVPTGAPEVVFVKGAPAALAVEFMALEDLNAASDSERFGRIRMTVQ